MGHIYNLREGRRSRSSRVSSYYMASSRPTWDIWHEVRCRNCQKWEPEESRKGKRRVNIGRTKVTKGLRLSFSSSTFTENSCDFPNEQTD